MLHIALGPQLGAARRHFAAGTSAALVLLFGCGHAGRVSSACSPAAKTRMARFLGIDPGAVASSSANENQTPTTCRLRARTAAGSRVTVTAAIDTAPQAYFRFERTVVEESQNFVQGDNGAQPQNVPRLGLDAAWFPAESRLMTTDGTRLVTITVDWPDSTPARATSLAAAIAQAYLGRLRPSAAGPGSG